jgi:hypothetical protein
MPDFDLWSGGSSAIDSTARAVDAWNRINKDPTDITLVRNGTALAAQTVRIEHDSTPSETMSDSGQGASLRCVVYGVLSHPAVADTDIEEGDRFRDANSLFVVQRVLHLAGQVQAMAESVT